MNTRPKKRPFILTHLQREVLARLVRRWLTPQQIAKRARVILESEQGLSNLQISKRIPFDRPQVGVWRERWIDQVPRLALIEAQQPDNLEMVIVEILSDAPRPGTPPTFTPEQVVQIVAIACENPQASGRPVSHWTPREVRDEAVERDIVDTISERHRIKHRESFRPFAPIVLERRQNDYFEMEHPSYYMLLVPPVKEDKRAEIPSVTHVDGTGRVQTVSKQLNPELYQLLETFENFTGTPVLLNTSFNDNGEPIIESPFDAIKTFLNIDLDYLVERS